MDESLEGQIRRHNWNYHFKWQGAYLVGRTPIGRVTVNVLGINNPLRVGMRQSLMEEGLHLLE
jgi:hypothetical protein